MCCSQIDLISSQIIKMIYLFKLKIDQTRLIHSKITITTIINLISLIIHCWRTNKNRLHKIPLSRILNSLLISMELTVTILASHLQISKNKLTKTIIWISALLTVKLTAARQFHHQQDSIKRNNPWKIP